MTAVFRLPLAGLTIASLLFSLGCQKTDTGTADPKQGANGNPVAAEKGQPVDRFTTARAVLERMVAAYAKASSYSDFGKVRLVADTEKGQIDQTANFAVSLVRPSKFRMQFYQATVICDGRQWYAYMDSLPGLVVLRDAPAKVGLETLQADPNLHIALTNDFAGGSPQLLLLLGKNPLEALLAGAQEPTLAQAETINDRECYRVQFKRADGVGEFWIDQQTFALRRMVIPSDDLRQMMGRDGAVRSVSVVAEFTNAQLDGPIDAKAFQIEVPEGVTREKFFIQRGPVNLIGGKAPDFKFVDPQGKPVTADSLAGKVIVLNFWASNYPPCGAWLAGLEQIYQKYRGNDKIAILAVSLDAPEVQNKALEDTFKQWNVTVPILRDPDQSGPKLLRIPSPLTTVLIGPDRVIQDCEMGDNAPLAMVLPPKLDKLLAGQDLSKAAMEQFRKDLEKYGKRVDDVFAGKQPEETKVVTAPKSEPKKLRLTPLWKCADVQSPGNILIVPRPGGAPRVLVIDGWKAVTEIGPDGKVLATHKPEFQPEELICNLRTAVGRDGKRVFAAYAVGHQRVHLFDENWKLLLSYPRDALKNPHQGIADVELGDLDGDGVLKAYIGYWGVVGVQAVSLDGKLLWSNRSLMNAKSVVIGQPDAQGHRELFCRNENGGLTVLDAKGQPRPNAGPAAQYFDTLAAADLNGDGQLVWCGIVPHQEGQMAVSGFTLKGDVLWVDPLPKGGLQQPIEPIIAGRVTPSGPGQWLLPGSDGSIHILSADGKPVDQFNYGAILGGMATAELDGKPVLIVSSENGLQAWRIEP